MHLGYDEWTATPARKAIYHWLAEHRRGEYVYYQELLPLGLSQEEADEALNFFAAQGVIDEVHRFGSKAPMLFRFNG